MNHIKAKLPLAVLIFFILPVLLLGADETKKSNAVVATQSHKVSTTQVREETSLPSNETNVRTREINMITSGSSVPEKNDRSWWFQIIIPATINIVGLLIGVLVIVWRVGKQHQSNLLVQQENFREELRLEIHQKLAKAIDEASSKISSLHADSVLVETSLEMAFRAEKNAGIDTDVPLQMLSITHKYFEIFEHLRSSWRIFLIHAIYV